MVKLLRASHSIDRAILISSFIQICQYKFYKIKRSVKEYLTHCENFFSILMFTKRPQIFFSPLAIILLSVII